MNVNVVLDSPIEALVGVGTFKLGEHVSKYYDIIYHYTIYNQDPFKKKQNAYLISPIQVAYLIEKCIELHFHIFNGKLCCIKLLKGFKGKYEDIYVGMSLSNFKQKYPEFHYDPEYECFISEGHFGVWIEQDVQFEFVESISLFVSEAVTKDWSIMDRYQRGDW